ncbi:MAG TPA: hypothetical protein VGC78_00990 [Gaiellaceae bacterium]
MGYVVFQELPDTPVDEVDVRTMRELLWNQHTLATRSAVRKIDEALTRSEDARMPIELEHHELADLQLVLREPTLKADRPSLMRFRLALEQLLA